MEMRDVLLVVLLKIPVAFTNRLLSPPTGISTTQIKCHSSTGKHPAHPCVLKAITASSSAFLSAAPYAHPSAQEVGSCESA